MAGRRVEHAVKASEKCFDALLFVAYAHAFNGNTHNVYGGKTQVATAYGCLLAIAVFEHACSASHCGHFVAVAQRVVGIPFLMLVE